MISTLGQLQKGDHGFETGLGYRVSALSAQLETRRGRRKEREGERNWV